MMNIFKTVTKVLNIVPKANYHFPEARFKVHEAPGLTAKRLIKCIGERLRKIDPARWEGVPITFKTRFTDEAGYADIHTSIHLHDAIEREFGIEIQDRRLLVTDVETAFHVVTQHHDPI